VPALDKQEVELLRKQGEGEWALSGQKPDQTGESLTAEGAGAGIRRVKPKETDKRQSLKSVLWKVEPDGRKGKRELRQPKELSENGRR
jgi:hypothetical protein